LTVPRPLYLPPQSSRYPTSRNPPSTSRKSNAATYVRNHRRHRSDQRRRRNRETGVHGRRSA
jgi:hypothetical protein